MLKLANKDNAKNRDIAIT